MSARRWCWCGPTEPAERALTGPDKLEQAQLGRSLTGTTCRQWRIEPLVGWHLPLLGDPAFLPLQPLLQRAVLLGLPERLLRLMGRSRGLPPQVLVAFADHSQNALGLIVTRRLNRSGSCWQVQHLRTSRHDLRQPLGTALLKAALERNASTSWVASAETDDSTRLALLRSQGFQPLRQDRLWMWNPADAADGSPPPALPEGLQLLPLNRRTVQQVWHLEQVNCPAQLRQIFDRRSEDVLDQSQGRGWLLLDTSRDSAVAAVRWLGDHPGGGHDVELSLDPGWQHLRGTLCSALLQKLVNASADEQPLWLRSDPLDPGMQHWLQSIQAQPRTERVLMGRSLWRRQALPELQRQSNGRLEAVLAQLQPGRRPVPTPLLRRKA